MTAADLFHIERGEGPPVVLLHGFPLDSRIWLPLIDDLSADVRTIAPDFAGFGKSPSRGSFTLERLADEIHAMLTRIGAIPCVLAGLSMGGYVAQAYAAKYAASLRGLILIDTRGDADSDQGKQARNDMIELAKTKGSTAVAERMMPKMFAPTVPGELVDRLRTIMNDCPSQTIQYASAAMRDRPDLSAKLARLDLPALIIVGESDILAPVAMAEAIQRSLRGSTLTVIPRAGHMTPMEQPALVAAAIRKFLQSVPGWS